MTTLIFRLPSLSLPSLLLFAFFFSLTACSGDPHAQEGSDPLSATERTLLLEADGQYPHTFGYLTAIRELPGGRFLAADPMGQVLVLADFEAGVADTLGRQGQGPEEYEQPDRVFPMPGDSSLLVDLGNGRLTVMSPEGQFVRSVSNVIPQPGGRVRSIHPRFVDEMGALYVQADPSAEAATPDSSAVLRRALDGSQEVPVATLWHPEPLGRDPEGKRPILQSKDDWAVGPDGRIAVVRANGYSVDWIHPDGTRVTGPSHQAQRYPVSDADMEAEMASTLANGVFTTVVADESGAERRQTRRGLPEQFRMGMDDFSWPAGLPIFRTGGTLVSPQGVAWVERVVSVGMPPESELFDGEGIRLGSVELPADCRVLGFGGATLPETNVYLACADEFGLIWLRRFRPSV
jgi:hypothetical protein